MGDSRNRILVVEDDPSTRRLLKVTFEKLGDCEECGNGEEALGKIAQSVKDQKPYNLICMDVMMPLMDGRELLKRCREIEERSKITAAQVIMITGVSDSETILGSFKDGCEGYLAKPISLQKLKELLKKIGFLREV